MIQVLFKSHVNAAPRFSYCCSVWNTLVDVVDSLVTLSGVVLVDSSDSLLFLVPSSFS